MTAPARSRSVRDTSDYYGDHAVNSRMLEYCGGSVTEPPSAVYVATLRDDRQPYLTWDRATKIPAEQLATLFADRGDLSRSLWDTRHLMFVFDLDYQNIDRPQEPFTHPVEVFFKLEPVYRATRHVLAAVGLPVLDVMTGRGYHFTGRIPLEHPVVDLLAALVPETPAWYAGYEARLPPAVTAKLTTRQACAATGLGLLLEHVAHLVLRRAAHTSTIPVVLNGTIVGRGAAGRECASLDFSHAGDPLDVRHARVAFGTYQWHRFRPDIFGPVAASFPPLVAIPRRQRPLLAMLSQGRGLDDGRRAARRSDATLPNVAAGTERLLQEYVSSPLAAFHRELCAEAGTTAADPPPLDVDDLPPCVAACLRTPNDLLLRPEHLQYLTRGLLARGWRASQIARVVQSTYEADHQWGDRWTRMHPRTRAEFDVRVFAGLVRVGLDRMVDYNCMSAQQKGVCPGTGCAYDLRIDRDRLLSRGRL